MKSISGREKPFGDQGISIYTNKQGGGGGTLCSLTDIII